MRLALIRQRYNPYGGAERFVALALEALKAQGVAVTVFARDWNTPGDTSRYTSGAGDVSGEAAGDAVPAEFRERFTPVICKVLPTRVRVES